jgi:DNA-directed RNA polymerase specialized sigma24 family protein
MIPHINDRLNDWASWVASGRKVVGLGYPSQCAFQRLTPSGSNLRAPIENEYAWEIERAVHDLDANLRDVVEQFYLHAGTVDSQAKALRICRDTLYVRLHMAHTKIMDWLQCADDDRGRLTASDRFATNRLC